MKKAVIISLVGVLVGLFVIFTLSYSYFTFFIDENGETTSEVHTDVTGNVSYITTSPTDDLENILPGWTGEGSTSVYFVTTATKAVNYYCTVSLEEGSYANNIYVQTFEGEDGQVPIEVPLTRAGVVVSSGTLAAQVVVPPLTGDKHDVKYRIIFKETGQKQNADRNQTFHTFTTCYVDNTEGLSAISTKHNVNVNVTNGSSDMAMKAVYEGGNAYFEITPNEGYTLDNATVTGTGCELNQNILSVRNIMDDVTCDIVMHLDVTHEVSISCTNCSADQASKIIDDGEDATFTITADGGYTLEGATVTGGCTLSNGTLTLENVTEDTECSVSAALDNRLIGKMQLNNSLSTRSSFDTVLTNNTTGTIYSTNRTDDNSTVYYYAGNTTNNWVVFGDNGRGTYYYWRIIRTNSNEEGGGVRLLYSGSGTSSTSIPNNLTNGAIVPRVNYNNPGNYAASVGYMYDSSEQHGHTNSSNIKTSVDNWYFSSNLNSFEYFINPDAVYCNDRSISDNQDWSNSSSDLPYAARLRLQDNKYPTYKCGGNTTGGYYENSSNRLADRFSKTTNGGGNGYLTYPIALMTADEVAFAGGKVGEDSNSWYHLNGNGSAITSYTWHLMSPSKWNGTSGIGYTVYHESGTYNGYLGSYDVVNINAYRPVISLKANVLVTAGDGTTSNPYRLNSVPYEYWSKTVGGNSEKYTVNQIPEGTVDSTQSLGLSSPSSFIRTVELSNNDYKHEVCFYYNGNYFCLPNDYWRGTIGEQNSDYAKKTMDDLKLEMETKLNATASSCNYDATCAYCYFDNSRCYVDYKGYVTCQISSNTSRCTVDIDGSGLCN